MVVALLAKAHILKETLISEGALECPRVRKSIGFLLHYNECPSKIQPLCLLCRFLLFDSDLTLAAIVSSCRKNWFADQ